MSTADPNWLLSTTAQSSAALVGIMGGLLVSRIVGLASERSALSRQEGELIERRQQLSDDLDPMERELRRGVEDSFTKAATRDAVDHRHVAPDDLLQAYLHESWHDDLRPLAERIVDDVRQAYERCEQSVQRPVDPDRITEQVDVPEGQEALYKRVARRVRRTQLGPLGPLDFGAMSDPLPIDSLVQPSMQQSMSEANRDRRRQELRDAVRDVDIQLLSVQGSLNRIGDVSSLRPTFIVLGVFAAVGVVQPVAMLARRPVPAGAFARWWVVGTFTVSLAVLLGVLWREVRGLTSSKSSRAQG